MLWVTPTDIDSNIIKKTAKKLSDEGVKVARIVPANTILVTCIASIGKNALTLEKSSFNQQINSLTPYKKYNPYFILTESSIWSKKMKQQGASGMMQMINKNEFSELETFVPNKQEQEKIGELFTNLDNLITLHQRKSIDFLHSWEQRKLGDECFELIAGGDIDKTRSVNNGKYPIYANALTNDGIVGYYNDSYRVKSPAVTITGRGEIGYAMARNTDFTPVVRLISLRTKHNNYFLANAINLLNVVSESTGVPQLTIPQVEKFDIYFPKNINEEIKLGRLFNEIDNLITLHQHKELKRRSDINEHLRW